MSFPRWLLLGFVAGVMTGCDHSPGPVVADRVPPARPEDAVTPPAGPARAPRPNQKPIVQRSFGGTHQATAD
jgi:hypothetical protein